MADQRFGATPEEWAHFDLVLGLGSDLLPVVSRLGAAISPHSDMKALGKTPSLYNRDRQAIGFTKWTQHQATDEDVAAWSGEPDYGISVITRNVRAIDIDVDDEAQATAIRRFITEFHLEAPTRRRGNSGKCLMVFALPGDYTKRSFKVEGGLVEFLATGQQFIAVGMHPSGHRYEWEGGLPSSIPSLTIEQFNTLWSALEAKFAIEPSTTAPKSSKSQVLASAVTNDPTAAVLFEKNMVKVSLPDGRLHIECPFAENHERESDDSATTYFPANTGGYARGHFHCLHTPCDHRTDRDFLNAIGIEEDDGSDQYEAVLFDDAHPDGEVVAKGKARFPVVDDREFSCGPQLRWLVKGLIPASELVAVYGPPGSGKSFWVLDLAYCIAMGIPWRDKKVTQGEVIYICAEGAGGFKNRIQAYRQHHGVDPETAGINVVEGVPNLMTRQDIIDLGNSVRSFGKTALIVYDTLARGIAGADENSAKDVGVAIANCRLIHDVTGATVLLIAHSGKDASKGMRGSNSLLGAVDTEIEISRQDDNRTATVTKMKDGSDGEQFGFKLQVIPVGVDEDGDVISSCVVEHGAVVARIPKTRKPGEVEVTVWRVLLELQGLGGEDPTLEQLVAAVVEELVDTSSGKKDQRRFRAGRAIETLVKKDKLKIVAGKVTIVGESE